MREQVQSRGLDFARIRVHDDDAAHRLAKDVGARAFVAGRDIFFRAGQYAPDTPHGRVLLEHELAHLPDAQTDAEHVYRAPLYDTANWQTWRFAPPPRSITVQAFRQEIQQQRMSGPNPAITSFQIAGATSTEQEIFLLNLVWHMSRRDGWDQVTQVDAQIGWPQPVQAQPAASPTPSSNGSVQASLIPTGVVRFSIDTQGAARAELLSPIVALASAAALHEPRATVQQRLLSEFGISRIIDRNATWQDGELRDVLGALTLLTGADRDALRGVALVRVPALPGGFAGQFSAGGGTISPTAEHIREPELSLANSAFASSGRVVGEATAVLPASFQTILHEVGHAVSAQPHRSAVERELQATRRLNRAVDANNTAAAAWRTAYAGHRAGTVSRADLDASQAAYNTAHASYVGARNAFTSAQTRRRALEIPDAQVAPLRSAASNAEGSFRAALQAATAAAAAYQQPQTDESAGYRGAVGALMQAIERYQRGRSSGNLLALEQVVLAAQRARSAARTALERQNAVNPALNDFAPVDGAQDQWWEAERMFAEASGRTTRLQRFVDLVTTNNILPLTRYARENWPHRPDEFYAETYALWRSDPEFLRAHYPALLAFFATGDYLR